MAEERLVLIVEGQERGAIRTLRLTNRELDRLESSGRRGAAGVQSVRSQLVGLVSAGAIAYGLTEISRRAIAMASDTQEAMNQFQVVFGEAADESARDLDALAEALGRNRFQLREFAAQFQDTFVPLGFARREAADLSEQLTQLTLDLSSFKNVNEELVAADLQTTLVGNHEAMRKYGVIITQTTLNQELLNMGIEGGVQAATEQEKVQARLNIIMAGTRDAQGDAARTADDFANKLRTLRASSDELTVAVGERLLPNAERLVDVLTAGADVINDNPELIDFLLGGGGAQIPTSPFTAPLELTFRQIERAQEAGVFDFIEQGAAAATGALAPMGDTVLEVARAHSGVLVPALDAAGQHIAFVTGLELDLGRALEEADAQARGGAAGMRVHEQALVALESAQERAATSAVRLSDNFIRTTDESGVLTLRVRALIPEIEEAEDGTRRLSEAQVEAAGSSDALARMLTSQAFAADQAAQRLADAQAAADAFNAAVARGEDLRGQLDPAAALETSRFDILAAKQRLQAALATGGIEDIAAARADLLEAQLANERALDRYNRQFNQTHLNVSSGLSAEEEGVRTLERAWDTALGTIRSAAESALSDLGTDATKEDFLLEKFGLRREAVGESVRQLNDIINRALDPNLDPSPWIENFEELQGLAGEELAANAIVLRDQIQDFLRPEFLNLDAAFQNAVDSIVAQRNKDALVDELTQRLLDAGYGESEVQRALASQFGTSADMAVGAFTDTLTAAGPEVAQLTNQTFVPAFDDAAQGVVELADTVDPELSAAVEAFRTGELADILDAFDDWLDLVKDLREEVEKLDDALSDLDAPSDTAAPPANTGPGMATGGSFIVPPGFPDDTFPVRVTSGERVTVQTPAQQQGEARAGDGALVYIENLHVRGQNDIDALGAELQGRLGLRRRRRHR